MSEFRRFKEARQLAERNEYNERQTMDKDPNYEPNGLKRTQVMIAPFCSYFDSFEAFEGVIQAINQARSNALSLITDTAVENIENKIGGITSEKEWR